MITDQQKAVATHILGPEWAFMRQVYPGYDEALVVMCGWLESEGWSLSEKLRDMRQREDRARIAVCGLLSELSDVLDGPIDPEQVLEALPLANPYSDVEKRAKDVFYEHVNAALPPSLKARQNNHG